jgi:hypothetical protein
MPMNDREIVANTTRESQPGGILAQLRGWWTGKDADAEYLAAATDLADLERRMRLLDRGSGGPVFETFNH